MQSKSIDVQWCDAGNAGDDAEEAIEQQAMFLQFACDVLASHK